MLFSKLWASTWLWIKRLKIPAIKRQLASPSEDEGDTIVSSFPSFEYEGRFDNDSQNHYSGKDRTEWLALGLSASFLSAVAV